MTVRCGDSEHDYSEDCNGPGCVAERNLRRATQYHKELAAEAIFETGKGFAALATGGASHEHFLNAQRIAERLKEALEHAREKGVYAVPPTKVTG